jgi:NDP-sugar pyrophosphorylase family protein
LIYKKSWKYILTKCKCECSYYHPKALKDFSDVKKGELGGYLEGYHNLSQTGNCWVYNIAIVRDYARVSENAQISDKAKVFDYACIYGNATVYGNAQVYGNAIVKENAKVTGNARVRKDIIVRGETCLSD